MRQAVLIITMILAIAGFAQDDAAVLTVDGQDVSRAEFEAIYKKNNQDADVTKEALDEYMELFINYKLKVREAEEIGMDTISKFQKELAGYRNQLARPYLIDKELNESLLKEAYERKTKEIRASHILVQVTPDAAPEDTIAAWNRIMELRKRVLSGEDFADVAKGAGGSDDPSAKKNGGDLGWFTALQMVYPFESAAYSTPVGEVSMPVRTRFGYHIIKAVDERPARGEITAAHIMLRTSEKDEDEKHSQVEKKIREVYEKVKEGKETFADLALKYSEDPGSSTKGGELPKFGTGKMVEAFEDAAFSLENDGDVSEPFQTQFGWHIVKRLAYEPIASFDDMKSQLKNRISKDSRAEMTKNRFIQRLKKEYGFERSAKNMKKVLKLVDDRVYTKGVSTTDTVARADASLGEVTQNGTTYQRELHGVFNDGKFINVRHRQYGDIPERANDTVVVKQISQGWSYDQDKAAKLTKPLFELDGVSYSQLQFLEYLKKNQRNGQKPTDEDWKEVYVNQKFNEWVDKTVMSYEDSRLEEKHPDFRMLMKEYRDGILLFELTDEMVWSKAVSDSAGLESYFEAHRNDFMWPQRWKATIYKCSDPNVAKKVRKYLRRGWDDSKILEQVNQESSLALLVESGTFDAEQKPVLSDISETGLSKDMEVDGQVVFVDVTELLAPAPKELDEARGMITAAYQDHLEKEWIKTLREKYTYEVHPEVLYSIK